MTTSRGVYGNFSVDYVVVRGGKQELDAYALFMSCQGMDVFMSCKGLAGDSKYDFLVDLNPPSCWGENKTPAVEPPLEQEQLVKEYEKYIRKTLRRFQKKCRGKHHRVLFVHSSYIPGPLIGITGARTEVIPCFLNCFGNVYVVNAESFSNPMYVDKWSVKSPLPAHLQGAHDALDSYVPVQLSDDKTELCLVSGEKQHQRQRDHYYVYTEDHITYIASETSAKVVYIKDTATFVEFEKRPDREYAIFDIPSCGITHITEYHSLASPFTLSKLKVLLSHLF